MKRFQIKFGMTVGMKSFKDLDNSLLLPMHYVMLNLFQHLIYNKKYKHEEIPNQVWNDSRDEKF